MNIKNFKTANDVAEFEITFNLKILEYGTQAIVRHCLLKTD